MQKSKMVVWVGLKSSCEKKRSEKQKRKVKEIRKPSSAINARNRGRLSYLFLLFFGTLHSDACIFPFLLWFLLLVFSQLFVRPPQQKRHRCIEQSFGLCGRGRRGMIWENGIETCIISYKKRIATPGSMQDTGSLGLVHWDDPEGWYGEGEIGRASCRERV